MLINLSNLERQTKISCKQPQSWAQPTIYLTHRILRQRRILKPKSLLWPHHRSKCSSSLAIQQLVQSFSAKVRQRASQSKLRPRTAKYWSLIKHKLCSVQNWKPARHLKLSQNKTQHHNGHFWMDVRMKGDFKDYTSPKSREYSQTCPVKSWVEKKSSMYFQKSREQRIRAHLNLKNKIESKTTFLLTRCQHWVKSSKKSQKMLLIRPYLRIQIQIKISHLWWVTVIAAVRR